MNVIVDESCLVDEVFIVFVRRKMLSPNKRSRHTTHEGNKKKGTSSYGHLKAKFAASEMECERLQVCEQELRLSSEIERVAYETGRDSQNKRRPGSNC